MDKKLMIATVIAARNSSSSALYPNLRGFSTLTLLYMNFSFQASFERIVGSVNTPRKKVTFVFLLLNPPPCMRTTLPYL